MDLKTNPVQVKKDIGVFEWMFGKRGRAYDEKWNDIPDFKGAISLTSKSNKLVELVTPFFAAANESFNSYDSFKEKIDNCPPKGYFWVKCAFFVLGSIVVMNKVYDALDFVVSSMIMLPVHIIMPRYTEDHDEYVTELENTILLLKNSIYYHRIIICYMITCIVILSVITWKLLHKYSGGEMAKENSDLPKQQSIPPNQKHVDASKPEVDSSKPKVDPPKGQEDVSKYKIIPKPRVGYRSRANITREGQTVSRNPGYNGTPKEAQSAKQGKVTPLSKIKMSK